MNAKRPRSAAFWSVAIDLYIAVAVTVIILLPGKCP